MPKHISENPRIQEVYDTIRHIDGVKDIDGRSTNLLYVANTIVLAEIISALIEVYGPPTMNHPLVSEIEWRLDTPSPAGVTKIYVDKADSIDGSGTLHHIGVYNF